MSITLHELTSEFEQLQAMACAAIDEPEYNALRDTLEGIAGEIEQKVHGCACVVKNLDAEIKALKEEETRLFQRRAAMEGSVNRLKTYMQDGMEVAGKEKIKGDLYTVAIQKNPPSVNIENEAAIPLNFKRTIVEVVRSDVKAALASGTEVPGASLVQTRSIRIR